MNTEPPIARKVETVYQLHAGFDTVLSRAGLIDIMVIFIEISYYKIDIK